MSWEMQVLVKDKWRSVHPSCREEPYRYADRASAEKMLKICYPDQCRDIRLGGEPEVRVIESSEPTNTET